MAILMMIKKFFPVMISILAAALIEGCSLSRGSNSIISRTFEGTELIPGDVNRICITEIANGTSREEIPEMLRSEIRRRINAGGRLYLTDDIGTCDIKVRITLLPLISEPLGFNAAGMPEERRIRVDVLVAMEHASTGKVVMKNRETFAEFIYRVTGKGSISEYRGITGLTEKLSERIISVITTGWYKEDDPKSRGR